MSVLNKLIDRSIDWLSNWMQPEEPLPPRLVPPADDLIITFVLTLVVALGVAIGIGECLRHAGAPGSTNSVMHRYDSE